MYLFSGNHYSLTKRYLILKEFPNDFLKKNVNILIKDVKSIPKAGRSAYP